MLRLVQHRDLALHEHLVARGDACRIFGVQPRGIGSGAALIREREHFHIPRQVVPDDCIVIAGAHGVRRLAALAIALDLSRFHRMLRQRTRLEKPRGP